MAKLPATTLLFAFASSGGCQDMRPFDNTNSRKNSEVTLDSNTWFNSADLSEVRLPPDFARRLQERFGLQISPPTLEDWVTGWLTPSCPTTASDLVLVAPSRHSVLKNGQARFVWCALDAMILAILEGERLTLETSDPETGSVIELTMGARGLEDPEGVQRSAILAFGFSADGSGELKSSCCPYLNLFETQKSYRRWCEKSTEAITIPLTLGQAWRLAVRWADAITSTERQRR